MTNNIRFEKWSYSGESSRFVPERNSGKVVYRLPTMPQRSHPTPAKPGDRKTMAQPPLPPPPNPKYQQPALAQELDMQAQEISGAASTRADIPAPYDVYTEGPITYFNYYFEEMGNTVPEFNDSQKSRSKLPLGFIGAGAVAATVVSGLVIGDVLKPTDAPKSNEPTKPSNQQDSAKNLPRLASASPEKLNTDRFLNPIAPQTPTNARTKLAPRKTTSLQQLQQLQNLPASPPIAMPETLALSQPTSSPQSNIQRPQVPVRNQAISQNVNIPRLSVQEAASRQAALSPVAQPETFPTSNQPAPQQPASVTPSSTNGTPNTIGLPPFAPSSDQTVTDQGNPAPIAPADEMAPVSPPLSQIRNPQVSNPQASTGEVKNLTSGPAIATSPFSNTRASQPAQQLEALKDYLALPQTGSSRAVSIMPLSQQAATEAANEEQIGRFTVRQVSPQDYQKEWVASNKTVEDPAIALAYPAYGFIDYQRQLIVVLQEKSQDAPMQSQRLTVPSS
ncbi:hypothetical protein OsccyDRAFT_4925 [Leptolyngbyaceae cyanobacterium JSC-12]|nr:hypothetical protein OsccyDRAFT_4925 [Leptolyngbyaceae cyanobacterium JSC-12]